MSGKKKTSLARIRTYAQDRDELQHTPPASATPKPDTVSRVITPVTNATPKPTPSVSAPVVFPPLQEKERLETPLSELEKSFSKPETPTIPKHIPAFHELTKELEHDLNPSTPPTSTSPQPYVAPSQVTVSNTPTPKRDTVALSGGTVITDTKRTDFNFFASVSNAITGFFSSIQEAFKPKKPSSTYTVTTPERRKGVVQKATSKTGTLFTADNETLKEAILRRQREEKVKKDITWSPQTEPGYPLLTEAAKPSISNVVVTFKKPIEEASIEKLKPPAESTRFEDVPKEPVTPPPVAPIPVPSKPIAVSPAAFVPPEPVVAPPPPAPKITIAPPPPQTPMPVQSQSTPSTVTPAPSSLKPKFLAKQPKAPKPLHRPIRFTELRSNIIALTATGILIGIIVLTITIRGLYSSLTPSDQVSQTNVQSIALLPQASQGAVIIPTGGINSIAQIIAASAPAGTGAITELRLLDANQQELTPQAVLTLLETQTNPNFNQAVTNLRLLNIQNQERGLLFAVTDPTTVFGAMLLWEPNLYSDIGPVLSSSPTQQTGLFIDRTIGQTDVRILVIDGTEVLTYGFIDRNLLLITTTSTIFSQVLETL